ncbi:MAG: bifunctional methylenetetrahydrofolate dehydrogenase/methenyltetrahydrofolate cyclohydrolase [Thermoplasmata archaeon HGW-Thermoplasmata-1]|nr:MAG: bifunctional methylenetetrahydrofolate dehydrogenase/methenyltetrahydrofolate cyclohydrolase [Thermoplasmata archaeon HGW-Thermoplasmata-1]
MTARTIDGKAIAAELRESIKREVEELRKLTGKVPGLATVLVGDDPASHVYVKMKNRACEQLGIYSRKVELPATATEEELLALIEKLNSDDAINGILVQFPPPKHVNKEAVIRAVAPEKDVDGFHPKNVGELFLGNEKVLVACTPLGVIKLLEHENIDVAGKEVVIINRSNIVGKPLVALMINRSATVTVCHSKTRDMKEHARRADILVSAAGREGFITADHVKEGATVIDVATVRREDGSLTGDVLFDEVSMKAGAITPSPGGVGPMTIACLMQNTLLAFKMQNGVGDFSARR